MKKNYLLMITAVFGFLGVALGAFGAHYLKARLDPEMLKTFNTGVLYHLIHTAVLLFISLSGKKMKTAFYLFSIGIVLFSFSLYIYSISGIKILAMVTPFGGLAFLTGWLAVFYYGFKEQ